MKTRFEEEYTRLNKAQKEAVDAIEGPVMVVAGPGTGKTQILALRIGNILKETDTKPDGILCLSFTNSGVRAMQNRLHDYIGAEGDKIIVSTFHSFAMHNLIEKHYHLLDFELEPSILRDEEAVFLCDEILHEKDWQYIRPRTNPEMYFSELKQLISILKRERLSPEEFLQNVEEEILSIKNDPASISSRGESKGNLKKEVEKRVESLERTKEVVEFYRIYEERKRSLFLVDYDDVLEYAVLLVEKYEDVRADIYENYQYVLVDEHQDSSGIQNSFLKAVWGEIEKPNVFVVGDDRQLIYGFSGASFSYFEEFSRIFKGTKLITLLENYRSNSPILALAEDLLASKLSPLGLISKVGEKAELHLNEYAYPRDEIIGAGLYFKKLIEKGINADECAILVPRNHQVRSAIEILKAMGLEASAGKNVSLFDIETAQRFIRVLRIIIDPYNSILLSESLLDKTSGVEPLLAHKFLKNTKAEKLSIEEMKAPREGKGESLFEVDTIFAWGKTLERLVKNFSTKDITEAISSIGNELFINGAKSHDELIQNVEVVRTFIHLSLLFKEKNKKVNLSSFLAYLQRVESYGNHISLSTFESDTGIRVMTLHKSKGLEYHAVWIAHMNEEVLMSQKKTAFTLPIKIKEHMQERDILTAKRELYVAITRAKEFCGISYAREDYQGRELELAEIIKELPEKHFDKKSMEETERELLSLGPKTYVPVPIEISEDNMGELKTFVKVNQSLTRSWWKKNWREAY